MRFNVLRTRNWLTKEIGARYLQGIGFELMLWNWHLQLTRWR